MSTVFIVAMTEVPSGSNLEYWLEKGTYLAPVDWRRLRDACCPLMPDSDDYDFEHEWLDACGLMFRAVFSDVFRWAESFAPADSTVVGIEGKSYFVSGGHSYGDPPTDSYDTICAFDELRAYLVEFGIATETEQENN